MIRLEGPQFNLSIRNIGDLSLNLNQFNIDPAQRTTNNGTSSWLKAQALVLRVMLSGDLTTK